MENFKKIVWPLPVTDLLFVGRASAAELKKYGVTTIGESAFYGCDGLLSLVGTVDVNYGAEIKKIQVMAVDMDQLVPKILEGRSHVRNNRKALLDIRTIR